MTVLITIPLILGAGAALYLWNKQQKVKQQNASAVLISKYSVLYNLLTQRRQSTIVSAKKGEITVLIKIDKDQHRLYLEELDDRLFITWKLKSTEFGHCTKQWSFNPLYSQNWMYDEILNDIRALQLQKVRDLKATEKRKLRAA